MSRLFIFGNSGAGKSTLARRLARRRGWGHVDLDQYAWTEVIGVRRNPYDAAVEIEARIGQAPHVIEGMYSDLVRKLARKTDELVWLDLPVEVCIRHCKARPFEPHKWATAEKQDEFLPQLLTFLEGYPERGDELGARAHQDLFEAHEGPKWRLSSAEEARAFEGSAPGE